MIYIGLTGWGDHYSLYEKSLSSQEKLPVYSGYFPAVEVDASFYAVQPLQNYKRWIMQTPSSFRFVVKAYQGMTGHLRGELPFHSVDEMFTAYLESIQPLLDSGKLAMVLFQFPPWFDCKKEHVHYLRYCKMKLAEVPLALEFRNQSWFSPPYRAKTLQFMKEQGWIHSVCDEPQVGDGSVPMILEATDQEKTLVRLHGRNVFGWKKPKTDNWREVRYLYRYNYAELVELKRKIGQLTQQSKDVYILFNNNSGGDAADNALEMIELLNIVYHDLSPRQLNLFD